MLIEALSKPPYCWTTPGLYPVLRRLFQWWVLDVVLGRVLVRQVVDDVEPLAVRVVDLDERLPLVRERVLGEDRLHRTLRFARATIADQNAPGQRERVLIRHDRTEGVLFVGLDLLDVHH